MQCFFLPVDNPLANHTHHSVGKHFRVNTEIFMPFQCTQHSVGDTADTQLEGIAVFDQ